MSQPDPTSASSRTTLDIEDFLQASSDASSRTRNMVLILIVASILAFAGLLNSIQSQWMHGRMIKLGNIQGHYTQSKLGPYPSPDNFGADLMAYERAVNLYESRYIALCSAVEKTYVETSFEIRVPFLGFTVDVNDLGLLAGIAFVVILSCYRFFLSREIDNLRMSFTEARTCGIHKLEEFYKLLAMRQVFTVPQTPDIRITLFLAITPKIINWFPLAILLAITWNDLQTAWIGTDLGATHYRLNVICEFIAMIIMVMLSISVTIRLIRIDRIWRKCWSFIEAEKGTSARDQSPWNLI